ncbi:MAG: amidohydrolase family protein [Leptospiraceae bacterium]|nr:amidohydrolase family protein [Leptospiraceae bacterium]MCP5512146.1 amidohydrolase family protein [Leptospiraceae bacterium]
MKNKWKISFLISVFLNLILIFFLDPSHRAFVRVKFFELLGFGKSGFQLKINDSLLITEFKPQTRLQTHRSEIKGPVVPFIESHGHLGKYFGTKPDEISALFDEYKIQYFFSLNIKHGKDFKEFTEEYKDPRIYHFVTFNWNRIKEEDGFKKMHEDLIQDFENGARGVKLWKNFGLYLTDREGKRIQMNDPRLTPLFAECARRNIVVSIHTADPEAFFYPIDETNERYEELLKHPEWSFEPLGISFDTVMKEREEMFQQNPETKFVALHFGEFAHRLDRAEALLVNHPNVSLDIAARIDELGRHPYSVRKFFLKWQDRILFGTDGPPDRAKMEIYARFLETDDEYFDYYPRNSKRKGFWKIHGIFLPSEVLEKIYYRNAMRLFSLKN